MSEGKPTQSGLLLDAQASLDHLLQQRGDSTPANGVVVFGRSLGGAVAIHLVARNEGKARGCCLWMAVQCGAQRSSHTCNRMLHASDGRCQRVVSRAGQVAAVLVENAFTSVEDMVQSVVPPLGPFIGSGGRPLNFLVTNKWRNLDVIQQITDTPMLLMGSRHVSRACLASCHPRPPTARVQPEAPMRYSPPAMLRHAGRDGTVLADAAPAAARPQQAH